ncbi:MAG: hypothetical protein QMD25_07025 [Caldisericia bacterium]|jgi:hypothetical protein|nr:hypothetical protein [Caldisericia bacterium]
MKKILICLIILGLIIGILYLIYNHKLINKTENKANTEIKTILPIVVGHEIKLLDTKSSSFISIPGNPEAEVVFGESIDGKWLIISEGKRELTPGQSQDFFISGWNLYRINKETGEKLPIVIDKNVIVAVRSPKDDIIAYVTNTFGLWLVNIDGSNKRQVVKDYTVIAGNLLWKKRTGEPFIFWSPDGNKISFSTFPENYKGEDLWEIQGVGIYLLNQNKFKILNKDIYNVFNVWGWFDNENILVKIAQPFIYDPKKNKVLKSETSGFYLINLDGKVKFLGNGYSSATLDILIKENKIYSLIPQQKRKSNDPLNSDFNISWQNLQIIIYDILEETTELITLIENLNDGFYARFTPDGRIIYENRDGRLVIINLDGSNPEILPPEIKPPIYFAP